MDLNAQATPLPNDEDALVAEAQRDIAAFGPLFDAYAPRVYRYLLQRTGTIAAAEDITSQVFADALESLGRYRPRRHGSFGGWLFTIARRRCADYFRSPNPVSLANQDPMDPAAWPLDEVMLRDDLERLADILKRLDESDLELLRLRFSADLSYRQIGEVIGKSEPATKMSVLRLVQRLKDLWEVENG